MKNILIAACAPIFLVFLTSCASTGSSRPTLAASQYAFPEWVLHPPLEDGAIYGVGSGKNRPAAQIESLVDIAYKLEVQINTVLAERSSARSGDKETVVASLMNQVSITEVTGAKIVEEYEAPNGITWMLTRLPEECIMDLTESALVTYALNLKMNEREITELVDDVEQRLASERIVNPLLAEEVEDTLEEDQRDRERELEEDLERQRERELEERRAKAEERESNIREKGANWWWGLANLTVGVVGTTFGVFDMAEKIGLSGYGLPSAYISSVGILYGGIMLIRYERIRENVRGLWLFNSLGTAAVIVAYAMDPLVW